MGIYSGIDIIEIYRIKEAIKKKAFLNRIFTDEEVKYLNYRKFSAETAAGMFAAKEAVSKLLGDGIGKINWKMIEVNHNENGKPYLKLYDEALLKVERMNIKTIDISISHNKSNAIAMAVGITGGIE